VIHAVVNAFNEEMMLPGCLESVCGKVDKIVVVDGAYEQFPHQHHASTDGTLAIAWCYGARIVKAPERAWKSEIEKRNRFFVGNEGDWYLQIDADERLLGELPTLDNDVTHYAFLMRHDSFDGWIRRLYQHLPGLRYEGAHSALWWKGGILRNEDAEKIAPEQAQLLHLGHLRNVERQRARLEYKAWQGPYERPYRDRHSL